VWALVVVVIVCVAIAGFWGVKSFLRSDEEAQKEEPPPILTEQPEPSTEPLKLTPEQELAALEKEGEELAEKLIREFPNSEEPLVLMGDLYRRRGNSLEAVKFWEKALKVNPKRYDVYHNIGRVAFEKEEYEKAVTAWRKTLEINPEVSGLRNNLARAFLGLGKYSEAIEELEKRIEIFPRSALSNYLLGRAYLQLKEYDKAKEHYEKVIELRPDHTNAHYGLSSVYAKLKQPDKAKEYLAIFKKLKAKDMEVLQHRDKAAMDVAAAPKALVALALDAEKLYRERGDLERAEELMKRVETLDPNNTKCLERLATLYQMSNRIEDALAQFEKMREIQPQNPFCYLNIGVLSSQLKRFNEASKAFQQAIALAPKQSLGYNHLARLYLRTNRALAEARRLAEKAVELEATAENYFVLGWACDVNGDVVSALAAMEQAVKLDPDNPKYKQIYEIVKKKN
jgi:tetratricopeptide (TPR) repeat protein